MKHCPTCRRSYTDETLQFCRHDGKPLIADSSRAEESSATPELSPSQPGAEVATQLLNVAQPHAVTSVLAPPLMTATQTGELKAPTPSGMRAGGIRRHKLSAGVLLIALLVTLAVGGYFYMARNGKASIESIAVMPFVNQNHDPAMEYLSDGMTESLINSLSQLPKLSVKARSSVFRYKGREVEPQQVGSELNVQAVLNGRITQRGDDLTLSLELVDARTSNQIWGEQYNRKLTDLIQLQSEIARDVSNKLRTRLSNTDEQRVTKTYTADPEAYQLYLQGLYYWNKRTPEDIRRSIALFQQAADKDPSYAQAYAGLALAYNVLITNSSITKQEIKEVRLKERAALRKAQELDDSLAEIHVELAGFKYLEWDFAAAENEYKRSIELNPNFATAHQWYADFLASMGRHEEAVAETNKAHEIDPFSRTINAMIGMRFFEVRRLDEAIAQYKKVIEMEPNYPNVHAFLSDAYQAKGMYPEAIAEGRAFALLEGVPAESVERRHTAITQALKTGGAQGFWRKRLELSEKDYEQGDGSAFEVAKIHARLGDKDRAFEWLEKSFAAHEDGLVNLKIEPAFDGLSSDPRFQDLLRRVGLPQ